MKALLQEKLELETEQEKLRLVIEQKRAQLQVRTKRSNCISILVQ
jgi:hypothetical protein